MRVQTYRRASLATLVLIGLGILPACGAKVPLPQSSSGPATVVPAATTSPDWFSIKMTDVRTGQAFTMNQFSRKVVLVETMAEWCITCIYQQNEVKKMQALSGGSPDLVHVSLDTDLNEDAASLKEYANAYGYDWYFAVSPLEADRAFANLYTPEFMNPPLAPMLFIDRQGGVHSLPYGVKTAESLQRTLAPFLAQ